MRDDIIQPLTIKELLSDGKYLIPIYQRNYDWSDKESLQLIEDIADYAVQKSDKNYYIGSLVVFNRFQNGNEYFETIDGQQRLTTLTILMNVLKKIDSVSAEMAWFNHGNLSYDHRSEADEALHKLSEEKFSTHPSAVSIVDVYKVIKKNLENTIEGKGLKMLDFVRYLLDKVIIMRIPVPKDAELNHYFEIMNSRGEQLEKHEVLKANLMDNLEKEQHVLFHEIWESCSDMSTYVQMKMKPKVRSLIFSSSWDSLQYDNFDDLYADYADIEDDDESGDSEDEYVSRKLSELFEDAKNNVKYSLPDSDENSTENNDRFGSIINFPNFLLQTLKVMYHSDAEYDEDIDGEIKLDDKRLIDIFVTVLRNCKDRRAFTKRYIMALLKCRHKFDKYVIKRETYNGKEGWSLKDVKKYDKSKVNYIGTFSGNDEDDNDESRNLRMLEAMFHVSAPTQIYKHWLNAILYYVYSSEAIKPSELSNYLYKLACAYMLNRYLCVKEERIEFEDIIYSYGGEAQNRLLHWCSIDKGCDVENFIFNYYDYLIWTRNTKRYQKFEFTYRTSVEHFYPQTPMVGYEVLKQETGLNDFGNLCLISRGMNSKFSNNMPMAKYKNFANEAVLHELSLKLNEMMDIVKVKGDWGMAEIVDFERHSREVLLDGIQKGVGAEIEIAND